MFLLQGGSQPGEGRCEVCVGLPALPTQPALGSKGACGLAYSVDRTEDMKDGNLSLAVAFQGLLSVPVVVGLVAVFPTQAWGGGLSFNAVPPSKAECCPLQFSILGLQLNFASGSIFVLVLGQNSFVESTSF